MELRWYWRILKRQGRVIWLTAAIVAVLALLFTAFTFYSGYYKATATVEFSQVQPSYNTQSILVDPLAAAEANGQTAANDAKLFTEGDTFFKGISAYIARTYHLTIDYKSIHLGATLTGPRQIKLDYSSSNKANAMHLVDGAIHVLSAQFLPQYQEKFQQAKVPGFTPNVYEPPITMSIFDPINARSTSLSSTAISWLIKALLGVVLGVALAFLFEYLDETIHDEHDVRTWMGAPTLGVIPGGTPRTA